jgi:hypothetical protein
VTSASGQARDQNLEKRLREEVPRAWAALEEFSAGLTGTVEAVGKGEGSPGPGEPDGMGVRWHVRFLRNKNWTLIQACREQYLGKGEAPTEVREWVRGMNSRYGFWLGRDPRGERWSLRNVTPAGPVDEFLFKPLAELVMPHLRRNSTANPERIADYLFKRRNLQIREVSGVARDGKKLVRVKYTVDGSVLSGVPPNPHLPGFEKPAAVVLHEEMLLDPDRYWVIRETKSDWDEAKDREVMEYAEVDGFPVLRRHEYRHWDKRSGPIWGMTTAVYKDVQRRNVPEWEFSVSAFGLPEIDPAVERPTPLWVWCLAGSVLAGGVAFAARRYARRQAVA